MPKTKPTLPPTTSTAPTEYTVVARRYRPQQLAELIGQEHVAAALVNALQSGRVAHAYLFTGARGVGKTSAARILAKALNCVEGPTPTPCDQCDSCKAIAAGEDVDVLEIDGASNNKVEEVRDLRQNVGFRPTRSRYKIYIIDEVHMLTTSAFNALLKTLEEPPPHVKFILATTEVQKIPITILSRCQRFDFAHVGPGKIFEQLKRIVEREGHAADDDALRLIARRAGGSMRDSQSLLDQLLAACPDRLTTEQVNAVLGTAGDERVAELTAAILNRDPKQALDLLARWVERGLNVAELVDQLIGYWRALMLVNCGGSDVRELPVTPSQQETITGQAQALSLDSILAGLELLSTTRARLRDTPHAQVLLEMTVVRLCRLNELLSIGQLVQALHQPTGSVSATPVRQPTNPPESMDGSKKNGTRILEAGLNGQDFTTANTTLPLSLATLPELWNRLIHSLTEKSPILASHLKTANLPAIFGPNSLAIRFPSGYNHAYTACAAETGIHRIQEALSKLLGHPVVVRVEQESGPAVDNPPADHGISTRAGDRKRQLMELPLFKKAGEALGAQIWHVDEDFNPLATPRPTNEPILENDLDET